MSKGLYCVSLIDYALPGFCSGTKEYCGTEEAIISVLSNPKTERDDLLQAAKSYFAGEGDCCADVLYSNTKFLSELLVLGIVNFAITDFTYKHLNIWECAYWMRAKHAECRLVYVSDAAGKYRRAVQLAFSELEYKGERSLNPIWKKLYAYKAWGHPGVLVDMPEGVMQNQLLFFDREFDSKKEALEDMEDPAEVGYSRFFDEIFADG